MLDSFSGLHLAAPPDGELVLRTLAASKGWSISVEDEATYATQKQLADQEGLFVEPAAISLAGVMAGIGFKDANALQRMVEEVEMPLIKAADILHMVKAEAT